MRLELRVFSLQIFRCYQLYKNASKLLMYPHTNNNSYYSNSNHKASKIIFNNHNNNTNTTHKANSTTQSPKVTLPLHLKAKHLTHCRQNNHVSQRLAKTHLSSPWTGRSDQSRNRLNYNARQICGTNIWKIRNYVCRLLQGRDHVWAGILE